MAVRIPERSPPITPGKVLVGEIMDMDTNIVDCIRWDGFVRRIVDPNKRPMTRAPESQFQTIQRT